MDVLQGEDNVSERSREKCIFALLIHSIVPSHLLYRTLTMSRPEEIAPPEVVSLTRLTDRAAYPLKQRNMPGSAVD